MRYFFLLFFFFSSAACAYTDEAKKVVRNCEDEVTLQPAAGEPVFTLQKKRQQVVSERHVIVANLDDDFYQIKPFDLDEIRQRITLSLCRSDMHDYFVDVNFDGYRDLLIAYPQGGSTVGRLWLYSPEQQQFLYSDEFAREVGRYVDADPVRKLLLAEGLCCSGYGWVKDEYIWHTPYHLQHQRRCVEYFEEHYSEERPPEIKEVDCETYPFKRLIRILLGL